MVAGDGAIRYGMFHPPEDSADDRHGERHPPAHRRGLDCTDDRAWLDLHREAAEAALVDRIIRRRREALVRDLGATQAGRGAGVEKSAHLGADLRKVDGHLLALLDDLHLDWHAPADV